jgi:hypothetical protein
MGKFDEKVADYKAQMKEMGLKVDDAALAGVTKAVGPNIYKADASKVSSTDQAELDRVKQNFCMKKLGVEDEAKIDAAIADVVNTFGSSNRNKTRAVFYYLLAEKFGKLGMFK